MSVLEVRCRQRTVTTHHATPTLAVATQKSWPVPFPYLFMVGFSFSPLCIRACCLFRSQVGGGFVEVIATSGDAHLGGDDFDAAIVDWLVDQVNTRQRHGGIRMHGLDP